MKTTFTYDGFGRRIFKTFLPTNEVSNNSLLWCNGNEELVNNGNYVALFKSVLTKTVSSYTETPTKTKYFDKLGRIVEKAKDGFDGTPNQIYSEILYNDLGQVSYTLKPTPTAIQAQWGYLYDTYGRIQTITDPYQNTATYTYSTINNKTSVTYNFTASSHPYSETISKTLDALGNITQTTDAVGGTVANSYNNKGKPYQINTNGNLITLEYDNYCNQRSLTDLNQGNMTYVYNPFGELESQTDNANNTTYLQYDLLGRLINKNNCSDINITYSYDTQNGIGLLASISDQPGNTNSFAYDNISRLLYEKEYIATPDIKSFKTSYTYDNTFNRVSAITYPSLFTIKYDYTSNGYLKDVKRNDNGNNIWKANSMNNCMEVNDYTLGENVVEGNELVNDDYGFNYSLNYVLNTSQESVLLQSYQYNFDHGTGNLHDRTVWASSTWNTETFSYDEEDRLLSTKQNSNTPNTINIRNQREYSI